MKTDEETMNYKIDMKFHNENEFRAAQIPEDPTVACFRRKFTMIQATIIRRSMSALGRRNEQRVRDYIKQTISFSIVINYSLRNI